MLIRKLLFVLTAGSLLWTTAGTTQARGTSIADNVQFETPRGNEPCKDPVVYRNWKLQEGVNGRIKNRKLRSAARRAKAFDSLARASAYYAAGKRMLGNAFTDISVTGRRSYASFLRIRRRLSESALAERAKRMGVARGLSRRKLRAGAKRALDRVYRVVHWLRFGRATRDAERFRKSLGYIAVSGEDDQPWRPVNNDPSEDYQYNLPVRVGRHTVNTRFIVAGPKKSPQVAYKHRQLKSVPALNKLPRNAKVLIYVHGMDSRLEEAGKIIKSLRNKYRRDNFYVISMDLPTSGYATHLDHFKIAHINVMGRPKLATGFDARGKHTVKVLDFIENFVVKFADTLDRKIGVKKRVWAVIGGSLGGNITFRLGRRNYKWIRNVVTWSPASIWDSATDKFTREILVREPWKRAGGDPSHIPERKDLRAFFFQKAFYRELKTSPAQSEMWWGKSFRCKKEYRRMARFERFEIYTPNFRKWHWRLGAEQMLYSHQRPPRKNYYRFMKNRTPMFLLAGSEDNYNYTNYYNATRDTARKMTRTPGRALLLKRTGHSIHDERPAYLTRKFVAFLKDAERQRRTSTTARFNTLVVEGKTTKDDIRRRGRSRGWVGVKLRSGKIYWKEVTSQANRGKRNLPFRAKIVMRERVRTRDIAALLVRHHSGKCNFCSRDYWYLRAELKGAGVTLVRTGDFRIGHQTRTFRVR